MNQSLCQVSWKPPQHNDCEPRNKSTKIVSYKEDRGAGSGNIVSKAPYSAFLLRNFEPTCPFGHGISNPDIIIESYTKVIKNRNINQIISYMRRYSSVLETGDASILLSLTGAQRRHAMEALTVLSKFTGCYDKWQHIRKSYSLHWTNGNESVQALQRFFDSNLTLDSMLSKVKEMICVLPPVMAGVIRFACITGLRPTEACESVRLLKAPCGAVYYNQEQQTLEHFRFPEIFLRPTKKAFLSYLSLDNYHYFASLGPSTPTLKAITSACHRRKIKCEFHLTRRIFASWLMRQSGIESEYIDLLQGRVKQSVLTRHYLSPSNDLKDRVLDAVSGLQKQIMY